MKTTCSRCKQTREAYEIAKRPGYTTALCKLCIAERSKAHIRYGRQLPQLRQDVVGWPAEKLASEIEWLRRKLEIVEAEAAKRLRGKASRTCPVPRGGVSSGNGRVR